MKEKMARFRTVTLATAAYAQNDSSSEENSTVEQ